MYVQGFSDLSVEQQHEAIAAFEAALAQASEASRSREAAKKLHASRARVFLRSKQVHMDNLSAAMEDLQPKGDSKIPHGLREQYLQLWTEAQEMLTDYQVHLQQGLDPQPGKVIQTPQEFAQFVESAEDFIIEHKAHFQAYNTLKRQYDEDWSRQSIEACEERGGSRR